MSIHYYNNSNIEVLTSKIIITIVSKIILLLPKIVKIINLPREKKLTEKQIRKKTKIIIIMTMNNIIALIMKKNKEKIKTLIKEKK